MFGNAKCVLQSVLSVDLGVGESVLGLLLNRVATLEAQQQSQTGMLKEILTVLRANNSVDLRDQDILNELKLPLVSAEGVLELEQKLSDRQTKKELVW